MFDWFARHRLMGTVLMGLLLVTMGVGGAMLSVMSGWFSGEDTSGDAFEAVGRRFTMGEFLSAQNRLEALSRPNGQSSLVCRDPQRFRPLETELAVRFILLELAQQAGVSVADSTLDEMVDLLKERNRSGAEINMKYSGLGWPDMRQYYREEMTIGRYLDVMAARVTASKQDAYENLLEESTGAQRLGWVELSYQDTRDRVREDLQEELQAFYDDHRDRFETEYRLGAEWILARVDREHDAEELARYFDEHREEEPFAGQQLEEVQTELESALDKQAELDARDAIKLVATVSQEPDLTDGPLEAIVAEVNQRTENRYQSMLEIGNTGGILPIEELPRELELAQLPRIARAGKAVGGWHVSRPGFDPDSRELEFYLCARTTGRDDPVPMSFAEVMEEGMDRILEVYHDVEQLAFQVPERRTVEVCYVTFEDFVEKGPVAEEAVLDYYESYRERLFATEEGVRELSEVREEVEALVRKRDAVERARQALDDLRTRHEAMGGKAPLSELASEEGLPVLQLELRGNNNSLEGVEGLGFLEKKYRSRLFWAAWRLTADQITEGECSEIQDTPTASYMVKVVDRVEESKQELDAGLRSRLLEHFITSRSLNAFRERLVTLRDRMSVPQDGAENPEDWDDEAKAHWRHHNRTRFEQVAQSEELEVHTTEGFVPKDATEVEGLSELVEDLGQQLRSLSLGQVTQLPRFLPPTITNPAFQDRYCLVTVLETEPPEAESLRAEQIDAARTRALQERREEFVSSFLKLGSLRDQPGVNLVPINAKLHLEDTAHEDAEVPYEERARF